MTDKLPPAWTTGYIPSQAEWQEAFADAITEGAQAAEAFVGTQITTLTTSNATNAAAVATAQAAAATAQTSATTAQAAAGAAQSTATQAASAAATAQATANAAATQAALTALSAVAARTTASQDQNMAGFHISNLGAATLPDGAPRLDQVSWTIVSPAVSAVGMQAIAFSLSFSTYRKFTLEWSDLGCSSSSAGTLYARFSTSGGSTYDTGNSYVYGTTVTKLSGTSVYGSATTTVIPVTGGQTGAQNSEGSFVFDQAKGRLSTVTGTSTDIVGVSGWSTYTPTGVTNVLIGLNSGAFTSGTVRLLGWRV